MILGQLLELVRRFHPSKTLDVDSFIDEYIASLFTTDDEFKLDEVAELIKEYLPECGSIPNDEFTKWIIDTRMKQTAKVDDSLIDNQPLSDSTIENILNLIPKACVLTSERRMHSSTISGDGVTNEDTPRMNAEERLAFMERYGEVSTGSSVPLRPVVTCNEEKKVRYLDGKVVDTTGKRYIEIKKEYPDMPKPIYLKANRKYRFH